MHVYNIGTAQRILHYVIHYLRQPRLARWRRKYHIKKATLYNIYIYPYEMKSSA